MNQMARFFTIERIKKAITHLQNYDSNWVIVPLVFAVNGVNTREEVNIIQRNGGDSFLNKYFSGDLMGLKPFRNNVNTLRPRFSEIYGNMKNSGRADDYVLHQSTKLWANVYSSRGYREMRNRGLISGESSRFKLEPDFVKAFKSKIDDKFRFEELLVWLYAFSGVDDGVDNWRTLFDDFQTRYLGKSKTFENEYLQRFELSKLAWKSDDLTSERPSNQELQRELLPSTKVQESRIAQEERLPISELNKIVYGPPGVGKSFSVEQEIARASAHVPFITTFHPEYTFGDFVGTFRPMTEKDSSGKHSVTYSFRPEVFTNAYVEAWTNPEENIYLLIEEINRGNSAAIFGDLFQLLDRDAQGYSEYYISCREEIAHYLEEILKGTDYAERLKAIYSVKFERELTSPYSILLLPSNLVIRATMNTSDQSLFPMDSAFKRRWAWEYIPIRYDSKDRTIEINGKRFSWNEFLRRVNNLIYEISGTEDKCIGSFFVKSDQISADDLRNKVIFYLWNDVLRDELPETRLRVFPKKVINGQESDYPVNFNDFFDAVHGWEYVSTMLTNLGLRPAEGQGENAPSV